MWTDPLNPVQVHPEKARRVEIVQDLQIHNGMSTSNEAKPALLVRWNQYGIERDLYLKINRRHDSNVPCINSRKFSEVRRFRAQKMQVDSRTLGRIIGSKGPKVE